MVDPLHASGLNRCDAAPPVLLPRPLADRAPHRVAKMVRVLWTDLDEGPDTCALDAATLLTHESRKGRTVMQRGIRYRAGYMRELVGLLLAMFVFFISLGSLTTVDKLRHELELRRDLLLSRGNEEGGRVQIIEKKDPVAEERQRLYGSFMPFRYVVLLRPASIAGSPQVLNLVRRGDLQALVEGSSELLGIPPGNIEMVLFGIYEEGSEVAEAALQLATRASPLADLRPELEELLAKVPSSILEKMDSEPDKFPIGLVDDVTPLLRFVREGSGTPPLHSSATSGAVAALDLFARFKYAALIIKAPGIDPEKVRASLYRIGHVETVPQILDEKVARYPVTGVAYHVRGAFAAGQIIEVLVDAEQEVVVVCPAQSAVADRVRVPLYLVDREYYKTFFQRWYRQESIDAILTADSSILLRIPLPYDFFADSQPWPRNTSLAVGVGSSTAPEVFFAVSGPAVRAELIQGLQAALQYPGPLDEALPLEELRAAGQCVLEKPDVDTVLVRCKLGSVGSDTLAHTFESLCKWGMSQLPDVIKRERELRTAMEVLRRYADTEREGLPLWTLEPERMVVPDRQPYGLLAGVSVEFNQFGVGRSGQLVLQTVTKDRGLTAEMALWFPTVAPGTRAVVIIEPGEPKGRVQYRLLDPRTGRSLFTSYPNANFRPGELFAMRIEVDEPERGGGIPVGIYVCLGDEHKSVVAGRFVLEPQRRRR